MNLEVFWLYVTSRKTGRGLPNLTLAYKDKRGVVRYHSYVPTGRSRTLPKGTKR